MTKELSKLKYVAFNSNNVLTFVFEEYRDKNEVVEKLINFSDDELIIIFKFFEKLGLFEVQE